MADDKKLLQALEEGESLAIGNPEINEEEMKKFLAMVNVWALFGLGLDLPPVGGVIRPEIDAELPVGDRVVPEQLRGKIKRHLLDPASIGIEVNDALAGFDRLLLLEYPIDPTSEVYKPAERPFFFGAGTRIDGAWAMIWHDSRTNMDKFIHCPGCVQTMITALMIQQKEWRDAAAHRKTLN